MPNGRHWCAYCNSEIMHWGDPCPNPRCGVPAEVAEGKRELTADEIILRNMENSDHESG